LLSPFWVFISWNPSGFCQEAADSSLISASGGEKNLSPQMKQTSRPAQRAGRQVKQAHIYQEPIFMSRNFIEKNRGRPIS
jgi:hypothetical protein